MKTAYKRRFQKRHGRYVPYSPTNWFSRQINPIENPDKAIAQAMALIAMARKKSKNQLLVDNRKNND